MYLSLIVQHKILVRQNLFKLYCLSNKPDPKLYYTFFYSANPSTLLISIYLSSCQSKYLFICLSCSLSIILPFLLLIPLPLIPVCSNPSPFYAVFYNLDSSSQYFRTFPLLSCILSVLLPFSPSLPSHKKTSHASSILEILPLFQVFGTSSLSFKYMEHLPSLSNIWKIFHISPVIGKSSLSRSSIWEIFRLFQVF